MFNLTFKRLREANVERCQRSYHGLLEWSPTDWACALAGEVGEACNLIKKQRRGEVIDKAAVGKELADVVIYTDLLAARLGLDLSYYITTKFNEVSSRVESNIEL